MGEGGSGSWVLSIQSLDFKAVGLGFEGSGMRTLDLGDIRSKSGSGRR